MKLIARAATALALLALATPALPCEAGTKTTTASTTQAPASTTVAKSGQAEKQKKAAGTTAKGETKPATSAN
jgi:hypothetical protein